MRLSGSKLAGVLVAGALFLGRSEAATSADGAGVAVNAFGLDLYRQMAGQPGNLCLSPYSVSTALAMTLAGADGETRAEMERVLHLEGKDAVDGAFAALSKSMKESTAKTEKIAQSSKKLGGPSEPITLAVANRLFPQEGFALRPAYLQRVKEFYGAPPEPLDFAKNGAAATKRINEWVAKETRDRIQNLIPWPLNGVRLVLANALYFKGPWANEFSEASTKPEPFHVGGGDPVEVATMRAVETFGFAQRDGFRVISLPYSGGEFQFVILLPDKADGLSALEKKVTAAVLRESAGLPRVEIDLRLPKFKLEPPTMPLASDLQALGMKSAFDLPPGSANFDRMAPRKPNDYLAISEVVHKTFIAVDEKGTEAAAATAVLMVPTSAFVERPKPVEVRVDRPFLYAIQHVPSGACLFLGRVTDPR